MSSIKLASCYGVFCLICTVTYSSPNFLCQISDLACEEVWVPTYENVQVVEASQDYVPLLLLTADRPPELQDAGANQSINQVLDITDY